MYYLVQAMEDDTNSVLPDFTKLFSNKAEAQAYAKKLIADLYTGKACGFDFAEVTRLGFSDLIV